MMNFSNEKKDQIDNVIRSLKNLLKGVTLGKKLKIKKMRAKGRK